MSHPNEDLMARRWPSVLEALLDCEEAIGACVESLGDVPRTTLRVDGIQLTSAFEPEQEAALQALLVPEEASEATLYGFGQGALPRHLLARPALETLRVVLLSRRAALAGLVHLDQSDWLADPRVELCLPAFGRELQIPFAASPADLRLADGDGARLGDLVRLELSTPHIARGLAEREEEFQDNLRDNAQLLETDADVGELEGSALGGCVRVCAAGPTLSDHFERLRSEEGPLIAVDAALKPLLEAGIVPDLVVAIDSLPHGMQAMFDVPQAGLEDSTLIYFPVVPHEVLAAWPGRRLLALGTGDRFRELSARRTQAVLWSSGSVVHPAIDLAVRMGARRVELFGADFATPRGKSHVDGMAWQRAIRDEGHRPWVLNGHGQRVASQHNLIGYLRDLERYLGRQEGVEFVNAGRDGARILGVRYEEELGHAA